MADIDPVATYLAEVRERAQAAEPGPWLTHEIHGRDIADEGWSDLRVTTAPDAVPVALVYLTNVVEPKLADENAEFIAASRTDVPRLLAAVEAVLAQHQPGRIAVLGAVCSRHEAHRHFSITSAEAADVTACPDCAATVYASCTGCGTQMSLDSCPARTAIAHALLGGGESGD